MAPNSTMAILKVIAELLIVFTGAVGVVGMFQDYYWLAEPNTITSEKIILKYFSGLLAAISYGISMLQRNRPKNHDVSSNRKKKEQE